MSLYDTLHPDERLDVSVESVAHQFKLSIRRNEGDGSVILKPGQSDTLVELHILQFYTLTLASTYHWSILKDTRL